MHILRLRGKLGWQTVLPSCECLAREADMARLQKSALTVIFTFPSPHRVVEHSRNDIGYKSKILISWKFLPLKMMDFPLEPLDA